MSKKVLIVTEEWAGSGHRMAAVALEEAIRERSQHTSVSVIGGLEKASPLLREISRISYANSIRYLPRLWQRIYNQEKVWSKTLTKPLGKVLGKRLLQKVIEQEKPDAVIATHAYCIPGLAEAKRQASKRFHLINVFTDFHINHFWIHPEVDYYVVPHERIGEQLSIRHNVREMKIHAYGIPVRPPFAKQADRQKQEWRAELGLHPELFTVLISGGEGGYGQITSVMKRLIELEKPLQLIVITGKNAALLQRLRAQFNSSQTSHLIHLLGYAESMWQWIGAADAYITKPGGLTCSEALAMKTPLVLYQPLPGQEQINCRFLRQQQAAEEAGSVEEIVQIIARWQNAREHLVELASRMGNLGRPDSAYRTAEMILTL